MKATLSERFWSKVARGQPDKCWNWTGALNRHGYGQFHYGKRNQHKQAHRMAWMLNTGAMPTLNVLHKCDNRACCNPNHLELGTQSKNMRDKVERGRDRSPRGESHRDAKLSEAQVLEILSTYRRGQRGAGARVLGKKYGIHPSGVLNIVHGVTWRHVTQDGRHQLEGGATVSKRKAPQPELNWCEAEPFKLVIQTTTDGDRVAAEKAQREKDRQEADNNQLDLAP